MDIGSRECYVGMLYACYDLIPLHVVMEVSWRHGLNDFTMVSLFGSTYVLVEPQGLTKEKIAIHDQLYESASTNDRAAAQGQ